LLNDGMAVRNNHIVIAANTSWYIYNFRLPLIRALLGKGWRITVLAPRDEYTDRIIAAGVGHHRITLEAKGTNPLRELATIRAFKSSYREISPAIALQYTIKPNIYGSIAARALGIPVINNVTGLGTMFSGGVRQIAAGMLYRYAFSRADLILFQNTDDRALFKKNRLVDPDRTGLLPGSGVDLQYFAPRPRGEGPFTFLLAARLLKAKGVEDFVGAARLVKAGSPTTRFVLLGRHDPADPLNADAVLIERAVRDGIVQRPGHTDDVRSFIADADCVVLPSYYREGVPRSLLEAASMEKPLIAADSVGTREPVRNGENGFLCRPRDPADLALKMQDILAAGPVRLKAMGEASRRLVIERFDEREVIAAYLAAVEKLAGTPEGGR
jgi:glycosyltransferase involved in cell wall biosynthesis